MAARSLARSVGGQRRAVGGLQVGEGLVRCLPHRRNALRADRGGREHADLQMGGAGDADDPAADLRDRLTRGDVRAHGGKRGRRVSVIDEASCVGAAVHEQHGRFVAESRQARAHYRPAGHGELEQPGAALIGAAAEVDALVERPPARRGDVRQRIQGKHPAAGAGRVGAGHGCGRRRRGRRRAAARRRGSGGCRRCGRWDSRTAGRAAEGDLRAHERAEQEEHRERERVPRVTAPHASLSRLPTGLADGLATCASGGLPPDSPQQLGSPAPGHGPWIRRR